MNPYLRRINMENRRNRLVLALMTVVLLLVMALGGVAPGAVEPWDGLEGRLVGPVCGGGSGT